MKKVQAPAIKTKTGRVVPAKPGEHHKDIPAVGTRGFKMSDGSFAGRSEAAKVATKAKQTKDPTKALHSHQLKGR